MSCVVEGVVDQEVATRLLQHVGAAVHAVHVKHGKAALLQNLEAYNHAARFSPWLVLVDLDLDASCAPPFRTGLLPDPAPGLCLRIAVRAVEAWLLADRERMARFLGVPISRVHRAPEELPDPKRTIVDLARTSRRPAITRGLVPRPGAGRAVGPEYTSMMIEFVRERWDPGTAARAAKSLDRALRALAALVE